MHLAMNSAARNVDSETVFTDDGHDVTAIRRMLTLRPTSRGKIIGQGVLLREALETIDRVARSSCTVLVTGESGTGKELAIAALHDASPRRAAPLVTINCGAIPMELVESELFGHARGAFTGAQNSRRGLVAAAEGGTLFLDEVGELPMQVQVKLLRLLQQREYTPVGESRAVKCDVRIAAATNRDLEAEVAAGRFREDLFYRLNVIRIHLPALRERREDIRLLASHFLRNAIRNSGREDLLGFSDRAMDAVEAHDWPGNIRALENAIERADLLARGPHVEAEDVLGRIAIPARPERQGIVREDPRREPEEPIAITTAAALPLPTSTPLHVIETNPTIGMATKSLSSSMGSMPRLGSNPAFPRVLPDSGVDFFSAVEHYQNNLIKQALARTGGNRSRAAQLLKVNRTTLVEIIRRRGL